MDCGVNIFIMGGPIAVRTLAGWCVRIHSGINAFVTGGAITVRTLAGWCVRNCSVVSGVELRTLVGWCAGERTNTGEHLQGGVSDPNVTRFWFMK